MKTLDKNKTGQRHLKKKKISFSSNAADVRRERRKAAQMLLAVCVAILLFSVMLYLLAPLLTRERIISIGLDGGISITDRAEKYSKVLE